MAAVPAGVVAGLLAWMAAGGASATTSRLAAAQKSVAALRIPKPYTSATAPSDLSGMVSAPFFAMTTGPGAIPEPQIQVQGLVRSPRRTAALLAINGQAAEWLARGEIRDGVMLVEVSGSKAILDTVFGEQVVALGERSPASAAPSPVSSPAVATSNGPDDIPPGFRSPPPPASAPKAY